jgi:hypothetical protein
MSKIYYDFDKGCLVNTKPKLSKNLLNANYNSIIRKKKYNNIDKYLHSIHKTDTYYDDLYNNSHISYNLEYKNENIISKLSYSEKIKKWKELINK